MCLNIPDFQNIASLPSKVWLASINKDGKQNDSASQDLLLVKVLLLWMWMNSPAFFFLFTHALKFPVLEVLESKALEVSEQRNLSM